jgi:hypothetical protein
MELAPRVGMKTPDEPLQELEPLTLEEASGGFKWDANSPRSTNVLDCRGPTCLKPNGEIDAVATRQHKQGIGHPNIPLPKGDGGPLGGPRVPPRK